MFLAFLFLLYTAHVFADVELHTKTVDPSGTAVTQRKWFVFEKRYHIRNVFIQVDTYSTYNAPSATPNLQKNRFTWTLYSQRRSRPELSSAKPVILEDQGANELGTEAQAKNESQVLGSTMSSTWEERVCWIFSLAFWTTCAATWLIFFLHLLRLYKVSEDQRRKTLKSRSTKSTSTRASLTIPLLAYEGSTKQKRLMP